MEKQAPLSLQGPKDLSTRDKSIKKCSAKYYRLDENNSSKAYFYCFLKWLIFIYAVAFVLSIPWEFLLLYQKSRAQKLSQVVQGEPSECRPDRITIFESFMGLLKYYISWTDPHTPCLKYYFASLVDPLWEVTPVTVVSSVIVKIFLHPLELISASLGLCIQLFFSVIPAQWQPVFIAVAAILIFLMMTMVVSSVIVKIFLHPLELISASLGLCIQLFFSVIPAQWQPVFIVVAVIFIFILMIMLFGYRLSVPILFRLKPTKSVESTTIARSNSYPKVEDHDNSSNKLKQLPYNSPDSKLRRLLPSLSTPSMDDFNNQSLLEESKQSTTAFRNVNFPKELSHSNSTTSSFGNSYHQYSLSRCSQKQTVLTTASAGEDKGKIISQFKQTVTVETSQFEPELESTNGKAKLLTKPKNRRRNVNKKKAKESDPLWTPENDRRASSDSE